MAGETRLVLAGDVMTGRGVDQVLPHPGDPTLHERWVVLLESLSEQQWSRTFTHPEAGLTRLDQLLALYSWHGRHHTAHITSLRERMGW